MYKNRKAFAFVLAFKLFFAWWILASVCFALLAFVVDSFELGLGMGCFFLPWVAGMIALIGSIGQLRGMQNAPLAAHLESFHHAYMHVPLPSQEVIKEAIDLLKTDLEANTCALSENTLRAVFHPLASPWWLRWLQEDELIVTLLAVDLNALETGGCSLEITTRPTRRFIYTFLWVDMGRNYRRLRRFQEKLSLRALKKQP